MLQLTDSELKLLCGALKGSIEQLKEAKERLGNRTIRTIFTETVAILEKQIAEETSLLNKVEEELSK